MAKQDIDARHYDVILSPHITEKSTMASEHNAVVFKVAGDATKPQIKEAVEAIYSGQKAKVVAVNTINVNVSENAQLASPISPNQSQANDADSGKISFTNKLFYRYRDSIPAYLMYDERSNLLKP